MLYIKIKGIEYKNNIITIYYIVNGQLKKLCQYT